MTLWWGAALEFMCCGGGCWPVVGSPYKLLRCTCNEMMILKAFRQCTEVSNHFIISLCLVKRSELIKRLEM